MASEPPLQPALLDRLMQTPVPVETLDRAGLKCAVLRDLDCLLNAVQPMRGQEAERHPGPAGSVLNYGLAPLAGRRASELNAATLEHTIREAILRFEPRLLPATLEVQALAAADVLDLHNVVEVEIRAQLWARPAPMELLLRTRLDLEGGRVELHDASGRAVPGEGR